VLCVSSAGSLPQRLTDASPASAPQTHVLCLFPATSQLQHQLGTAQAAAEAGAEQSSQEHQAQLDRLSAKHAARVQQLQDEVAADAARRADVEARLKVGVSFMSHGTPAGAMGGCTMSNPTIEKSAA